ncbi:MAG: hypothetical protein ACRDL4_07940 [Thermoleophilaceae bacterium]
MHGLPRVWPSITQNSVSTGISTRRASHGRSCSKPGVHADLAPLAGFPLADQQRAATRVEIWFGQGHRLADSEACPSKHDDQSPQA